MTQTVDELIAGTTQRYEHYLELAQLSELSSLNRPHFEAPEPPPLGICFGSK